MDPSRLVAAFRALHDRVNSGTATPSERDEYQELRAEVARTLAAAQGLTSPIGQAARRDFRVAHPFAVELNTLQRAVTHDVSHSGFSALVPGTFSNGQDVQFAVLLPSGRERLEGHARVVSSVKKVGTPCSRVSFAFVGLEAAGAERLDDALFDAVLPRLN
jgi:hypothetical protein